MGRTRAATILAGKVAKVRMQVMVATPPAVVVAATHIAVVVEAMLTAAAMHPQAANHTETPIRA